MTNQITRRQFLKGFGAAAAMLSLSSVLSACGGIETSGNATGTNTRVADDIEMSLSSLGFAAGGTPTPYTYAYTKITIKNNKSVNINVLPQENIVMYVNDSTKMISDDKAYAAFAERSKGKFTILGNTILKPGESVSGYICGRLEENRTPSKIKVIYTPMSGTSIECEQKIEVLNIK